MIDSEIGESANDAEDDEEVIDVMQRIDLEE